MAVLLIGLATSRPAGAAQEESAPTNEAGRRYALLVGCTEYPVLEKKFGAQRYQAGIRLEGPANDVALMASTLRERLGVPPENMTQLVGWPREPSRRPTRRNILRALQRLAAVVRPGDLVILQMSGHGTQQPDREGDELDGLDEVFLCADAGSFDGNAGSIPNAISDDELGARVGALRDQGAFVWLIVDTCHSGTIVRGSNPEVRFRQLDRADLGVPDDARRAGRRRTRAALPSIGGLEGVVAFYGAQPFHKAPEMPLPAGKEGAAYHGLLTFLIAEQLQQAKPGMTFQELQARLVSRYQGIYGGTLPMVEGDRNRGVFDGLPATEGVLLAERKDEAWQVPGGELLKLGVGTVLEVARTGEPALGRLEVVEATLTESRCQPVVEGDSAGWPEVEDTVLAARVVSRPVGDYRLRLAIVDAQGGLLPKSEIPKEILDRLGKFEASMPVVNRLEEADWIIELAPESWVLRDTRRGGGTNRFEVEPSQIVLQLKKVFRARNLRRLATADMAAPLPEGLLVMPQTKTANGEWQDLASGGRVEPGQDFRVQLRNETQAIYDVTLLYLDAHDGVMCLFPDRGKSGRLTHYDRKTKTLGPFTFNDQQMGSEGLIMIAVPRGENSSEMTFANLAQEPLRPQLRGGETGFKALMDELAFGTTMRGLVMESEAEAEPCVGYLGWSTEWPDVGPPAHLWSAPRPVAEVAWTELAPVAVLPEGISAPGSGLPSAVLVEKPAGVLLLGKDQVQAVAIDTDAAVRGKADPSEPFEAEVVFHFFEDRAIAYYDTDNDGRFDLILIDDDADPEADTRFSWKSESWQRTEDVGGPWLSSMYLPFLDRKLRPTQAILKSLAVLAETVSE